MIDDPFNRFSSDDHDPTQAEIKKQAAIMKKLQELTKEADPTLRKRLTGELTLEVSQMLRENQEMKVELIAFIRRLKST